jgi:hypothetical protein
MQETIRDGAKPWMSGKFRPWKQAQRVPTEPQEREKVKEKLDSIRDRKYVEPGWVISFISFFAVAKGLSDIRMVYDGTKSGLNRILWAPWFPLPTVETLLRSVEAGIYLGDNDVGEMFLNFMLHEDVRELCSVDFSGFFPEEVNATNKRV